MDLENTLKEKAKIFDRALNGTLTPKEPKIIYDAIRWIPLSGGKRLRPIIAMLSCEAVGGRPENTIPLGIALECLHNATIIHDDIIDGDKWRRGLQTTNEKFGLPLAKSITYKKIIRSIADASKRLYEGEAMDKRKRQRNYIG